MRIKKAKDLKEGDVFAFAWGAHSQAIAIMKVTSDVSIRAGYMKMDFYAEDEKGHTHLFDTDNIELDHNADVVVEG